MTRKLSLKPFKAHKKRLFLSGALAVLLATEGCFAYNCYSLQKENEQKAQIIEHQKIEIDNIGESLNTVEDTANNLYKENQKLNEKVKSLSREVKRGDSGVPMTDGISVEVTAYTLSEASCNKGTNHPAYGRTATGRNLAGQTLESARAIAVDPRVIPLGSRVRIHFKDKDMQRYDGVYTAVDTGGAIQGNRIDLFAGEGAERLAMHIGRRQALIQLV